MPQPPTRAPDFLTLLGRIADAGWGVGESRRTRTPTLFSNTPYFNLDGRNVTGTYDAPADVLDPAYATTADALRSAYRRPVAIVASGNPPADVSTSVRHESAHDVFSRILSRIPASAHERVTQTILDSLTPDSSAHMNSIVGGRTAESGPVATLHEAIGYSGENPTDPRNAALLNEINTGLARWRPANPKNLIDILSGSADLRAPARPEARRD